MEIAHPYLIKQIYHLYSDRDNLKVLDIGCNRGTLLMDLYANNPVMSFDLLRGVDRQLDFLESWDLDGYKAYNKIGDYAEKRKVQKGVFDFQKSDGLAFLQNDTTKYDIVLFCNYLHFFDIPGIKMHLQYAMERLNNSGLIGIVALRKFGEEHNNYITAFNNERVEEIFREYKTAFSEKTEEHVYLGIQKGA